jgi:hypothetical protein
MTDDEIRASVRAFMAEHPPELCAGTPQATRAALERERERSRRRIDEQMRANGRRLAHRCAYCRARGRCECTPAELEELAARAWDRALGEGRC